MARKRKPGKKKLIESLDLAIEYASTKFEHTSYSTASEFLAQAKQVGNTFQFEGGWVIRVRTQQWMGSQKTFYDVFNAINGNYEARDLGLFMSAMGIVKACLSNRSSGVMKTIIIQNADHRYSHHLNDAAIFGRRVKTCKDSFKKELYQIRLEEAMINCRQAKHELHSYI